MNSCKSHQPLISESERTPENLLPDTFTSQMTLIEILKTSSWCRVTFCDSICNTGVCRLCQWPSHCVSRSISFWIQFLVGQGIISVCLPVCCLHLSKQIYPCIDQHLQRFYKKLHKSFRSVSFVVANWEERAKWEDSQRGVIVTDVFLAANGGDEGRGHLPLQQRLPVHVLEGDGEKETREWVQNLIYNFVFLFLFYVRTHDMWTEGHRDWTHKPCN